MNPSGSVGGWRWVRTPLYNHSKDRDALELPRTVVLDDLEVDARIGSESSVGHVYLAKYRPTGESVALKVFPYDENEVGLFFIRTIIRRVSYLLSALLV